MPNMIERTGDFLRRHVGAASAVAATVVASGIAGGVYAKEFNKQPAPVVRGQDDPSRRSGDGVESTPTPTVVYRPTATAEVRTDVKTLPKPAAWSYSPTVNLIRATSAPSFPKTAAEAAFTFGVDGSTRDPKRWEHTAEGDGWHLSEAQIGDDTKDALNVNPRGWLMEAYYDTLPGRNPYAMVAVDLDTNIPAQGGTFWKERGCDKVVKLQNEMAIPKWKDGNGSVTNHPAEIIAPADCSVPVPAVK